MDDENAPEILTEALDEAIDCSPIGAHIYVCHGEGFCTFDKRTAPLYECQWCHMVVVSENTTAEKVLAEMEVIRRGH